MREPDLDAVNRALSVTVQKQADEIERLRAALEVTSSDCKEAFAENERLRAALRPLSCTCTAKHHEECSRSEVDCPFWNARAALEGKDD